MEVIDFNCNPVGPGELQYIKYKEGITFVSGFPSAFGYSPSHYPVLKVTAINADGEFSIIDETSMGVTIYSHEIQSHTIEGRYFKGSIGTPENPIVLYASEAGLVYLYTEGSKNNDNDFISTIERDSDNRGLVYSPDSYSYSRYYPDDEKVYRNHFDTSKTRFVLQYTISQLPHSDETKYLLSVRAGRRMSGSMLLALENKAFSMPESELEYKNKVSIILNKKDMDKKVTDLFLRVKNIPEYKGDIVIRANISTALILLSPESLAKFGNRPMFRGTKHPAVYGKVRIGSAQIVNHSLYKNRTESDYPKIPSGRICGGKSPEDMYKLSLEDVLLKIRTK